MKKKLPTITVVLPFHNEAKNLRRLLSSFKKQTYPRKNIEYLLIDDDSTDKSLSLAKKFGGKIIRVKNHNSTINKGLGLHNAKGDFIIWFDADMEIIPNNFFELMTKPLIENSKIAGSFDSFELKQPIKKEVNSITRFLSFDPIHRDPLYGFLVPSVASTIIEEKDGYSLCKYEVGKMPTSGMTMYRRKQLLATNVGKIDEFRDVETIDTMIRAGHKLYAFVPDAVVIHYHANSIKQLLRKRRLNLIQDFLPHEKEKKFKWIDINDPKEALRIFGWIIWANLFIPELVRGVWNLFRRRDIAALWQPIIAIATTDIILWVIISTTNGRKFLVKVVKSFLRKLHLSVL